MNALTEMPNGYSIMEYTPQEMHHQVQVVQHLMKEVMKEGDHYGTIPGCGPKPALLKAGAEKLCFAFRMAPAYQITLTPLTGGHREYQIVCELRHIVTGQLLGSGVGCCSTMESKYRYRGAKSSDEMLDVQVPKAYWDARNGKAEAAALLAILAKAVGEPGRYGTKKNDADQWMIVRKGERTEAKEENPDIADTFNTVLKMAKKRAHVDAVLTATAASDIFAQDIEENPELYGGRAPEAAPEAKPANGYAKPAEESKATPERKTAEGMIVAVHPNTLKSLADKGWRGIEFDGGEIAETNDVDILIIANAHAGTNEPMIVEVELAPGKEFPLLVSLKPKFPH